MTRALLFGVFLVMVASISLLPVRAEGPSDAKDINVAITSIQEHRTQVTDLDAANEDETGIIKPSGVTIVCRLTGAPLQGATKYGKLQISQAVDDVGTDLLPNPKKIDPDPATKHMLPIARKSWVDEDDTEAPDIEKDPAKTVAPVDVPLHLSKAARNATMIASLKGEVQVLTGGERKDVIVEKVSSITEQVIDDPSLKAAGLTAKIVPHVKKDPQAMLVQISGNFDALINMKLVDSESDLTSEATYLADEEGNRFVDIYADGEIADTTSLKIELAIGQKLITVPLEFKDVKLP